MKVLKGVAAGVVLTLLFAGVDALWWWVVQLDFSYLFGMTLLGLFLNSVGLAILFFLISVLFTLRDPQRSEDAD